MEKKKRNYYVDWWSVRKSVIYGAVAIIVFLSVAGFGGWWAYKSNWFNTNIETDQIPKNSARLLSFEGDVRIIRAATRETILVTRPTYLLAGDTIQTQADGKAQVQMIDGSMLSVRPNSTVVIRDNSSLFGGQNVRVALDGGQINVKTQELPDGTNNVVEVKQSENKLFSDTDASFGINQKTDGGEIRISRGGVETSIGGEKTILQNGEFASVDPNGKLSTREKLLAPPKLLAPAALEKIIPLSNGMANLTLRWQKPDPNGSFNYRLEVSTSPLFAPEGTILEREPLGNTDFGISNLPAGNYFWRVRAIAASGQTSEWSDISKFTVVKREESSGLSASDWQVERVGGNIYLVMGKTQPGLTVKMQGRETFAASDGSFRLQISTTSSEVPVEISDEHGNRIRMVLSLTAGRILRQY